MSANTTTYRGMGFSTVLGIVFIVLKITDFISWSWWWVLSPFWIPWVIAILFVAALLIYGAKK